MGARWKIKGDAVRWKSGLGSAAVAAIALSALGITPALAEEPPPVATEDVAPAAAEAPEREARDDPSPCDGIDFAALSAERSVTVTDPGDGAAEGTLRWAIEQANEQPGIDEVVIAAGLQVRTTGDMQLKDGLILRGADASSEIMNVSESGDPIVWIPRWNDDFPVLVQDLVLSGALESDNAPGLDLSTSVCALGLHSVTMRGFTEYGVIVGDTWPFTLLDIQDSLFTQNRAPDGWSEGAVMVDNEGIGGAIRVSNSEFSENEMTGLAVTSGLESLPGERGSAVIENSRFVNNQSAEEDSAGGLSMMGMYFEDYEDEDLGEESAPTTPMLIVRDSLFSGNSGQLYGAMNVQESSAYSERGTSTTLVSIERTTFAGNSATGEPTRWDWPANDLGLGDMHVDESPGTVAVLISDSTFTDPVDPSVPTISYEELSGSSVLEHVTLVGGGISYLDAADGTSIALRNSVLDTGDQQPFSRNALAFERAEPGDGTVVPTEHHMAYSQEPEAEVIPAGPGRVIGTSEEFVLGALDASLGPTPVRVPAEGSKLLDAAGDGGAATDQRGMARPQGAAADIGAVEVEVVEPQLQPATFAIGADQSVDAGDALEFTVSRTNATENPWTGEATVRVKTADGTAKAGADYTAVDAVLSWAADDVASQTVTVPSAAGHAGEGDVTLTIALSEPGEHAALGARVSAAGTIVREADPGTVVPPKPKPQPTPGPELPGAPAPGSLATTGQGSGLGWLLAAGTLVAGGAALLARRLRARRG